MAKTKRSGGLEAAIKAAGGLRALGRLLGVSHQAIMQWKRIPQNRLVAIEKATGVAREKLCPDLYR